MRSSAACSSGPFIEVLQVSQIWQQSSNFGRFSNLNVLVQLGPMSFNISRERKVRFAWGLLPLVVLLCSSKSWKFQKFGSNHQFMADFRIRMWMANVDVNWDVQLTQNACDWCTDARWYVCPHQVQLITTQDNRDFTLVHFYLTNLYALFRISSTAAMRYYVAIAYQSNLLT